MDVFKSGGIEPISYPDFFPLTTVHILRDDKIHPIVCGNKWRKLKYVIPYLKENNYNTLVSFGGAYSNHLVATAFAGHHFNISTHAFIRGNEKRELNHYEKTAIGYGMTLTHVDRSAYRDKKALFEKMFGNDPSAFFLDEGGDHPLALLGCAEIIGELNEVYDYIVLPLGTGTTMEGLLQGIEDRQLPTKVIGISSLKNNFDLDKKMERFEKEKWEIFHDYHRGKYGKTDAELIAFIRDFMAKTNVSIETVYTGKMMMGFVDLIKKGFFKPEDKVLLLHTGGLMNV